MSHFTHYDRRFVASIMLSAGISLGGLTVVSHAQEASQSNQGRGHGPLSSSVAETLKANELDLLSGMAWRLFSDIALPLLSGNRAELLSGNEPQLLSENEMELLSGNETGLLSGNSAQLLSGNSTSFLSHNQLTIHIDSRIGDGDLAPDSSNGGKAKPTLKKPLKKSQAEPSSASREAKLVKAMELKLKAMAERIMDLEVENKALKNQLLDARTDKE